VLECQCCIDEPVDCTQIVIQIRLGCHEKSSPLLHAESSSIRFRPMATTQSLLIAQLCCYSRIAIHNDADPVRLNSLLKNCSSPTQGRGASQAARFSACYALSPDGLRHSATFFNRLPSPGGKLRSKHRIHAAVERNMVAFRLKAVLRTASSQGILKLQ
jgi:hypothetical protein